MKTISLKILADYFHIKLVSDLDKDDHSPTWNDEEMEVMVSAGTYCVYVFTVRNMNVPLTIHVSDGIPIINQEEFDQIVECSIDCSSGYLEIENAIECMDSVCTQLLPSGFYGAYVCFKNLNSISEDGIEGNDSYQVFLWRIPSLYPINVMKYKH
jgi:hypothetical protein